MPILTFLRENIDSDELGGPSYATIANSQAILGRNGPKRPENRFFEVQESYTTGPLGPPGGSILLILTCLRENIDFDELGDPSYAKIASTQAILGRKW